MVHGNCRLAVAIFELFGNFEWFDFFILTVQYFRLFNIY